MRRGEGQEMKGEKEIREDRKQGDEIRKAEKTRVEEKKERREER